MVPLTYLPIVVGVVLFCLTFYIRSKIRNKDKSDTISTASTKSAVSPTVIEKPEPKFGPVHIYFASQTGTAQNFAKVLAEEASREGFEPQIVDLVDFTGPEFFKDVRIALFTVATQGEGDPTENSKTITEYITSTERNGTEFKDLKFSVFALGNKQYQFYCGMGKKFNQQFEKLGGTRVYKYGEGDDNENLEDDFNSWKEGIWTELIKVAQASPIVSTTVEKNGAKTSGSNLPFIVNVNNELKEVDVTSLANDNKEYDFQAKQYLQSVTANITQIRELRQKTHDGSTIHVEIDLASAGIPYKTAQNLAIYPENSSEIVNRAASVLDLNLEDVFEVTQNPDIQSKGKFKHPVPSPISIRTYLTKFCDLHSAIRKKQLKDLAPFCSNEDNKNKLLFLASNEGKGEHEIQINSRMKGLLDIIEEFDVKLTLSDLLQISSLILPRLYTIASSNKKHPGSVHLCVSIQNDALPDGKSKFGLTSAFLVKKQQDKKEGKSFGGVRINIRESTFALPTDSNCPIIMVGPGAGLAPFKGFLDEKIFLAESGAENPYGDMTLYFGCKGEDWDYLYKEEILEYQKSGHLGNLHCAFSRAQEHKVYVQDLIMKNRDQVTKLLFESNGVFYICGSMAMGKTVMAKLAELAAAHYKIDLKEAQVKIEELEKSKKIIKELWG